MEQFVEFKKVDIEQSIPGRFEQQVRQHSKRLAVKSRQDTWSYEQLNAYANRVAFAIRRLRGDRLETVALLLNQGAPLVGSVLGALKAGKIYLPLDRAYPVARLAWMLDDADTTLILTSAQNLTLAESLATGDRRVLYVDDLSSDPAPDSCGLPLPPDTLAYLYYTSGSTGQPKGVADTHRNVLHNVMRYTNALRISPGDRLTLLQSASFSGAVSSMFGALLNGASSFPFDVRAEGPTRLAAWLQEECITMYHSVPMIFRSFLDGDLTFPSVRVVRLEGDAPSTADVALFKKYFSSSCVLANGLGATETGLACQYFIKHDTDLLGSIVPIGFPTADMDILLLDESGNTVGENAVGEIAVRSEHLAPGYWKRPDLTMKAFVPDATDSRRRIYRTGDMGRRRPDGCLEYLGRKDSQFKIRGHRVEPAEVESALLNLDNVKETVVTTRCDFRNEARLIAYVVPARKPVPSVVSLRSALAKVLPEYMVPTRFVFLESLPLTENGKVDARALPSPGETRVTRSTPVMPPRDDVERQLITIWENELGVRPLGVTDDFFESGGDSLAATRLMASVERMFGESLPSWTLTSVATIEQLACLLRIRRPGASHSTLVPIQPRGAKTPLFCVHDQHGDVFRFVALSRLLGDAQPLYGLRSLGLSNGEQPLPTIEAMAARYLEDLRAIQPRGPYCLCGFCYGAVVAFEMAHQLRARNETTALLALLNVSPFDFHSLMTPMSRIRYRRHVGKAAFLENVRFRMSEAGELPPWEWITRISAGARQIPSYLKRAVRRRSARFRWNRDEQASPPPPAVDAVTEANRQAFKAYVPRPSHEQVVLVLDQEEQRRYTPDAAVDYRGLTTGELVVHIIPGPEHAMMQEPGVHELSRLLRRHLG